MNFMIIFKIWLSKIYQKFSKHLPSNIFSCLSLIVTIQNHNTKTNFVLGLIFFRLVILKLFFYIKSTSVEFTFQTKSIPKSSMHHSKKQLVFKLKAIPILLQEVEKLTSQNCCGYVEINPFFAFTKISYCVALYQTL